MHRLVWWQRAIGAIGALKVVLAIGLFAVAVLLPSVSVSPWQTLMLANVVAFGGSAAALILGAQRDRRAALLGLVLLLEASAFGDRMLEPFQADASGALDATRAFFALQADAFAPYFLWAFVSEFPRATTFGGMRTVTRIAVSGALIIGTGLFAINVALLAAGHISGMGWVVALLSPFSRNAPSEIYWALSFGLCLLAFPVLLLRARLAPVEERRRVSLLVGGLVVAAAPPVGWALLSAVSLRFREILPLQRVAWLVRPSLLAVPLWTAYTVLVHHALDVRLVVRRAMQYALARQTVVALAAVPFVLLALELWQNRDKSVRDLMTSGDGAALAAFAAFGLVALRGRRVALDRVDRRFFREHYDARHILGQLVHECRQSTSRQQLGAVLLKEIDRALHVDRVHLLVLDARAEIFTSTSPDIRPLAIGAKLVEIARLSEGPIDADVEATDPVFVRVPPAEQSWLLDAAVRLVVPLKDAERRLLGLLLLGEKKSELPYSEEDRFLLGAVASAAALSLSYVSMEPAHPGAEEAPGKSFIQPLPAAECPACGYLDSAGTVSCGRCGSALVPASVPLVVAGKFHLIQRIGEGAMGLVYRGLDVQLDRPVAIKTLPRLQPDEAWRLRREARAIAALSHPNLALIYGGESWEGTPILVLEYLAGGTLAARLASRAMPVHEMLEMGIILADAVAAIHRARILHRDIKPTNIGFTTEGTPKLLDFGIARLLGSAQRYAPSDDEERANIKAAMMTSRDDLKVSTTTDGQLVGTPLYMSPEAVSGQPPEPSFDVWGLSVVLYESVAGTNPFRAPTVPAVLRRIRSCDAADLRSELPSTPRAVAAFFEEAFSPDRRLRPSTAAALRDRLVALRAG